MPLTEQQTAEIAAARAQPPPTTLRPTVPALEALLYPGRCRCWTTASSG